MEAWSSGPTSASRSATAAPEAIELCEQVFHADSECALELLALVAGDAGADARWRLALAGIDRIMDDLLDDREAQHATIRHLRDAMAREHRADAALKKAVGAKFRDERDALAPLLRGRAPTTVREPLAAGLAILDRRSEAIAEPLARAARARRARAGSRSTLPQLASDLAHMQTNRLLRSAHRAHEMVLYDVLDRLYMARAARRSRA